MKLGAKFWWKVYFWLMTALAVAVFVFDFHFYEMSEPSDVLEYGIWFFSLIGVFGFAYSKIIVSKRLWQVWLPIVVLWDVGLSVKQYLYDSVEIESWFLALMIVIGGILVLPEYLALYFYGYRSNPLWASKK